MSPIAVVLIALSMSADAFAAAIGRGVAHRAPAFTDALRVGAIFGVVETVTPAIGWLLGRAMAGLIEDWDHWVALGLLSGLGIHMIREGLRQVHAETETPSGSFWLTVIAGFATSVDALAAGVSLAFLDVSIIAVSLTIGFCTFVMVTVGVLVGARFGLLLGKRAEVVGGVVLIAVGIGIAYQHTTA